MSVMVNQELFRFIQESVNEDELTYLLETSLEDLNFDFNNKFHVFIRILRPPVEPDICNIGE